MPRQPAAIDGGGGHGSRGGAARLPRPAVSPVPQLHHLPPESPRIIRGSDVPEMRALLVLFLSLPLVGQQAAPKPEAQPAPAAQPKPAAPSEQQAASPVPAGEPVISGSVDFGYRWVSNVGGSLDAYRSIVNLGEGPKLTGLDFTVQDPKHRLFDRLDVRGYNWGDDPYTTAHISARKRSLYDFNFDYRNLAYFNYLPSFADPLLDTSKGIFLNERSYDLRRKMSDFELDLLPGNWITPYLAYSRDAGSGHGVTTFVLDATNEYPVPDLLRDETNTYRGGVRVELRRFHATLEEGGTTFKDDHQVYNNLTQNYGNRTTPYAGQQLYLGSLLQAYGIRGDGTYSKVLVTANPFAWMDVYGQFLYSQPNNDVHYNQYNTGNFALLSSLLLYNGQQDLATATAKMPHTAGSLGFEVRPLRRVRVIESWSTDRLHSAGIGQLAEQFLLPNSASLSQVAPLSSRLVMNYNQQQVDVLVDVTSRLTLRGGHRYVWGDGQDLAPVLSPNAGGLESGELRRQVGLAGASFHSGQKFSFNVDFEGASSDRDYFRTSLYDYQRARARARYQAFGTLALSADFSILNNQNPSQGIHYDFLSRQNSVSALWTPAGGKRVTVLAEYSRSTLRSDINFLVNESVATESSFYRDNSHAGTVLADFALPAYAGMIPKISLGGSYMVSSGSRPTSCYQPLAKLALPLCKNLFWTAEWRYYGFGEAYYLYEGFRAHIFMTGLRLTK